MGLFDKKFCEFCGKKIGLLGNNKLEDGNMCGDCEKKLSVWFRDRRHTTVDKIRAQLAYREANAEALQRFHPTLQLGTENDRFLLVDERAGTFVLLREGVTMKDNPDVLDLARVKDAQLEIVEEKSEERYKDAEGKLVSYSPKHYHYRYRFVVTVDYDGEFFTKLKFPISYSSVDGGTDGEKYKGEATLSHVGDQLLSQLGLNADALRQRIVQVDQRGVRTDLPGGYRQGGLTTMKPRDIETYETYEAVGRQIVGVLLGVRETPQEDPQPMQAASPKWTCVCGAVNEGNFCMYCGTKRP